MPFHYPWHLGCELLPLAVEGEYPFVRKLKGSKSAEPMPATPVNFEELRTLKQALSIG